MAKRIDRVERAERVRAQIKQETRAIKYEPMPKGVKASGRDGDFVRPRRTMD